LRQRATIRSRREEAASGSRCNPVQEGRAEGTRSQVTENGRFIAGLGGAMKGRALSTGCPGLYLYAVKDSRVPPEIDLIYAGPFLLGYRLNRHTPLLAALLLPLLLLCPSPLGHPDPVSIFQERRRAARTVGNPGIASIRIPDMAADKSAALISRGKRRARFARRGHAMNYACEASYVGALMFG